MPAPPTRPLLPLTRPPVIVTPLRVSAPPEVPLIAMIRKRASWLVILFVGLNLGGFAAICLAAGPPGRLALSLFWPGVLWATLAFASLFLLIGAILAIPLTLLVKALLIDADPTSAWMGTLLTSSDPAKPQEE